MWPWGHLAVGYLIYTAYVHLRRGEPPGGPETLLLALGTQFPDLVDKPLAWTLRVLPSGRSLAHSLFAALVVTFLVWRWTNRNDRSRWGLAFAIGYFSHLATDAIDPLLSADYSKLTYLGWPLLPAPDYGVELGFVYHFTSIEFTPAFAVQLLVAAGVVWVWSRDGAPGAGTLRMVGKRLYRQ